ncbi:8-amino-7-oxononanoate synthase [Flavobacterium sp.]|uniref:8-amino-7-oxononanoate synthase n=1 Tax=Flavobacterium sp. TaxID=239 RepID=UPI00286DE446|nr:8-amino-7-oxononanoate synthase [Flavobacterium sp.]
MDLSFSFKIYSSAGSLPQNWDALAIENIFLSKKYLQVLDESSPKNMICNYIGLYKNEEIVGLVITQMLTLTEVSSFGVNKSCIKSKLRDFVFKNFAKNVLLVGNNMLTGQNAFIFSDKISVTDGLSILKKAVTHLKMEFKSRGKKIHITSFKDFTIEESKNFKLEGFKKYSIFSTQPNMVFTNLDFWKTEEDYVTALSKKYRDHYKRARKKSEMVVKRQMTLEEITENNPKINELYLNVTKNAPFNTFYLAENHFANLKDVLGDKFLFYGYFLDEKLIGFNTIIVNGTSLDTYFLGYDNQHQKDKMLYLNMLYDMIGYSIAKKYSKLIFSRTALEIKSSVGAKPIEMVGFINHSNQFINRYIGKLFRYFDPKVTWIERNPFK